MPQWFGNLRREMDDLFDQFAGRENGGALAAFAPRVNVAETEKNYDVTVDLPGLKPEDFEVEVRDGNLWLSGHRKQEEETQGKTYHRVERSYGEFRRVIPLAADVDAAKIEAEYKDGVLKITVPKNEAAQPKKIQVKA
jgi:HSP20 family protein